MNSFGIKFVFCNILISCFIGIITAFKHIFKKYLSPRAQYNLWFLVLFLLAVPFIPVQSHKVSNIITLLLARLQEADNLSNNFVKASETLTTNNTFHIASDFAVSVDSHVPDFLNLLILGIWIIGMLGMSILFLRSLIQLHHLKAAALPVENGEINCLFKECLTEMNIRHKLPLYSTLYLKSPATIGIWTPGIYLPLHVISDSCFGKSDLRYIFLHELQHYRHKDTLVNAFANLAGIVYWFNPVIWYALKKLRAEREIACDTSVLQTLPPCEYKDYGNSLINFTEKISHSPFQFAMGVGNTKKEMKQRIVNIAQYRKQSFSQRVKSRLIYVAIACFIVFLSPVLSLFASNQDIYHFNVTDKQISYLELPSDFQSINGSFVLYDKNADSWTIYNKEMAQTRISPNSTYKIYSALLGLEEEIISPDQSEMAWDGTSYPYKEWENSQTLTSAMHNSVNWYFQSLDKQSGLNTIQTFLNKIEYGNEAIGIAIDTYWMESSLKISPIEQVELLQKFQQNDWHFNSENVNAVEQAIQLDTSSSGTLYGKTGTGRVNDMNTNGWFIGYVKSSNNVYYFATNIQGESDITGSKASELTLSLLSRLNIWN